MQLQMSPVCFAGTHGCTGMRQQVEKPFEVVITAAALARTIKSNAYIARTVCAGVWGCDAKAFVCLRIRYA